LFGEIASVSLDFAQDLGFAPSPNNRRWSKPGTISNDQAARKNVTRVIYERLAGKICHRADRKYCYREERRA
jgi:hypothetical protein